MSADIVNIHAQVESVLGALVKVAAAELSKLFESRYAASAATVEVGRADDGKGSESPESFSSAERRRSIGVQVDEDIQPQLELSYGDCSTGCGKELEVQDSLFAEDKPQVKTVTESVNEAEFNILEKDHGPQTDATLDDQKCRLSESPQAKKNPLVVKPLPSDEVSVTCPLTLRPESPAPQPYISKTPVKVQLHQACASTAEGSAYSPSFSDGAVTTVPVGLWEPVPAQNETKNLLQIKLERSLPDQKLRNPCVVQLVNVMNAADDAVTTVPVGLWEPVHAQNETKNLLQIKLERSSPDQKLRNPCVVQLVNVMNAAEIEAKFQRSGGDGKKWPMPKDLRRHQGVHTGHRLCCFTPCQKGIWRLQKVISHSRDGYACAICGKTFKRRKILRRHGRFHTGEKPYSCSKCSKTFALRKSLRRHLRFHTGERPHKCTHCGKSFRLRVNLKTHLRFHTGEKPYQCNMCGKMFRILGNLDRHKLNTCGLYVTSFRTIAGV